MAGTGNGEGFDRPPAPFGMVAVLDGQRQGTPGGESGHQAAGDFHPVYLDFHTAAGAVAMLAALQVGVDGFEVKGQAGRQAFQDGSQLRAVGFTGGQKSEGHDSPDLEY